MTQFTAAAAADYDQRIVRLTPGYLLARGLSAALLADRLGDGASVLVAGCGTGSEIMALAEANPTWRFTGVDPSAGMVEVARRKIGEAGLEARAEFHVARLEEAPVQAFDGAVAFLVSQFVPDDGAKLGFFKALAARLEPDAPLLSLDFEEVGLPRSAYCRWLTDNGQTPRDARSVLARIAANWSPMDQQRQDEVFREAGFGPSVAWFQALGYVGRLAVRSFGVEG